MVMVTITECPRCMGCGYEETYRIEHHPECDGSCSHCPIHIQDSAPCSLCDGAGEIADVSMQEMFKFLNDGA